MSDCLPCQKKADPLFLEMIKQRKQEGIERAKNPSKIEMGTSIQPKEDGSIEVHTEQGTNEYKVISQEYNNLVVKYEGTRPIAPHRKNV